MAARNKENKVKLCNCDVTNNLFMELKQKLNFPSKFV